MDTKLSSGRTRQVYEFMLAHRHLYDVRPMCRVLEVTPSGIAEYIEAFYNPTRRHSHLGGVSPTTFEVAGSRR